MLLLVVGRLLLESFNSDDFPRLSINKLLLLAFLSLNGLTFLLIFLEFYSIYEIILSESDMFLLLVLYAANSD